MKKIYHLGNCTTCQRIIKDLGITESEFEFQNIKEQSITAEQLDQMKEMSGSYESLFSRRAMKFRAWGLNEKRLGENDYRKYILEEYTFLKRPVIIVNDKIFVGNTKKEIERAAASISS